MEEASGLSLDSERETDRQRGTETQGKTESQRQAERGRDRPDKKRLIRKQKYKKIQSHGKAKRETQRHAEMQAQNDPRTGEQQSEAGALTTGPQTGPAGHICSLGPGPAPSTPSLASPHNSVEHLPLVRGEKYHTQPPPQLLICLHRCRWEQAGL